MILIALCTAAAADPQPGDIFREYVWTGPWRNASGWQRVTDPETPRSDAQGFLPNPVNQIPPRRPRRRRPRRGLYRTVGRPRRHQRQAPAPQRPRLDRDPRARRDPRRNGAKFMPRRLPVLHLSRRADSAGSATRGGQYLRVHLRPPGLLRLRLGPVGRLWRYLPPLLRRRQTPCHRGRIATPVSNSTFGDSLYLSLASTDASSSTHTAY